MACSRRNLEKTSIDWMFDDDFLREANEEYLRAQLAGILYEALRWSDEDSEAP